jgi:hypothetical protein
VHIYPHVTLAKFQFQGTIHGFSLGDDLSEIQKTSLHCITLFVTVTLHSPSSIKYIQSASSP